MFPVSQMSNSPTPTQVNVTYINHSENTSISKGTTQVLPEEKSGHTCFENLKSKYHNVDLSVILSLRLVKTVRSCRVS